MKVRLIFAWYDIWVGIFIDQTKRKVYIALIPCIVLVFSKKPKSRYYIEKGGDFYLVMDRKLNRKVQYFATEQYAKDLIKKLLG